MKDACCEAKDERTAGRTCSPGKEFGKMTLLVLLCASSPSSLSLIVCPALGPLTRSQTQSRVFRSVSHSVLSQCSCRDQSRTRGSASFLLRGLLLFLGLSPDPLLTPPQLSIQPQALVVADCRYRVPQEIRKEKVVDRARPDRPRPPLLGSWFSDRSHHAANSHPRPFALLLLLLCHPPGGDTGHRSGR